MCGARAGEAGFVRRLAEAIRHQGGPAFDEERAARLAREVWGEVERSGPDDFPHMIQEGDLRFVWQWDEAPPVMTVMLWDGEMWRDMERLELPGGPPAQEGD